MMNFRDSYQDLLTDAMLRASEYLQEIAERSTAIPQSAIERLSELGGSLPVHGEDPRRVLGLLDDIGSPATAASAGRRFYGGVVGGALPVTVAAQWLAAAWDQNACLFDISPVSACLEDIVLGWLLQLFGLPPTCGGAFVTGTQMADVTALAAARLTVLRDVGWNIEEDGLAEAPPINVFVGEEVHATMLKALRLLGFGKRRIHFVPADSQGRMQPSLLPKLQLPAIVCTQVGNVNTGACDPVGEICERAHASGAWVHVDGAFGLWASTSRQRRHLLPGLERADSWATDAHKWLNVPQDSGVALVRERELLRRAMYITAAYYPDPTAKREPMAWGPESSRRARAVEIWAALRSLGSRGVEDLIERTCRCATLFADGLREAGFEVLNDVVLNQVLVSFGNDENTERVIRSIQQEGTCWCGGTTWQGKKAMRISVSSWATTEADVKRSLNAMLSIARETDEIRYVEA